MCMTASRLTISLKKLLNSEILGLYYNTMAAVDVKSSVHETDCIFCGIVKENDGNKLLYQDDEIVAFADIKPAAKFHYLIVPRQHIADAKCLNTGDKHLVESLVRVAKTVLEKQNADTSNARFGFHWPPFHTVSHLHLHAISPVTDMKFVSRLIFKPDSYWFVTPEYVLSKL